MIRFSSNNDTIIIVPLTDRDQAILKYLEKGDFAVQQILSRLNSLGYAITKPTLNRDLRDLEDLDLISKKGVSRATVYSISDKYKLIRPIDFAEYFSVSSDDRRVQETFKFDIYPCLLGLFTVAEQNDLDKFNKQYRANVSQSSETLYGKELERLVIELSWKSSKLEGNTYTLLDTEKLIKDKIETKGHPREEATMILNHKKALDYVIKNKKSFAKITPKLISKIHALLSKDLEIKQGYRIKKVGIIGTKYKPLRTSSEIKKAISQLCKTINREKYPLAKALIAVAMMSYIQAFEDGNKRTARILATAMLMAYNYCPLSYRNVDDYDYKKSLLLFYEQNNIVYLKQLFVQQFIFAVEEYF